jgi:hypothetical protein
MTTLEIDKIKKYFPFHRRCVIKTLMFLVSCILQSNNCNLNEAKNKASSVLGKEVNVESSYVRFIRFFKVKHQEALIISILRLIQHLLAELLTAQSEYILSMDRIPRTREQLGKVNINILMIGIVLDNGRFIPIYFELLDKKGNSNQLERIELLDFMKTIFEVDKPLVLVADREFIGKNWFVSLQKSAIDFVIRIRKTDYQNDLVAQMGISEIKLHHKIRYEIATKGFFVAPIKIKGVLFYYHVQPLREKKDEISKSDKDIYIRFLSTKADPNWISQIYCKRWKIEVFFEDIKEKGIRLEEINFKDLMKIRLMVAIASLCYVLCLKQGLIEFEKRPIKYKLDKKSGNSYLRTSIFTKGFSALQQIAFNIKSLNQLIIKLLEDKPQKINNYPIIQLVNKKVFLDKSV